MVEFKGACDTSRMFDEGHKAEHVDCFFVSLAPLALFYAHDNPEVLTSTFAAASVSQYLELTQALARSLLCCGIVLAKSLERS